MPIICSPTHYREIITNNAQHPWSADIRLRNFTNSKLPSISLNAAGELLLDHFDEIVSTDKNPIYDELFAYARGQSKTVFQTELDQIKEDMLNDLRIVFHIITRSATFVVLRPKI